MMAARGEAAQQGVEPIPGAGDVGRPRGREGALGLVSERLFELWNLR